MSDDRAKTPRTLLIADHLWEIFSAMAVEMGSERDALVNQALYTFARLNGFLVASDLKALGVMLPQSALTDSGRLRIAPPPVPPPGPQQENPPSHPERMAEPLPHISARPQIRDSSLVEVDHALLEESAPTSMALPNIAAALAGIKDPPAAISAPDRAENSDVPPGGRTLVLLADGRELDRVVKDRFLIGRGKHCDLIINSGKVSREHAAIVRDGGAWFIEDLGSSNGTWFEKRRISRRKIEEGDEYYICSEKLSCAFR